MITCALAACGPRDVVYDTSPFRLNGAVVPKDIAVPSNASGAPSEYNGLYTEGPDALNCCWIAPHATLLVRKHRPANRLVAGFWVPDFPRFAEGQQVTIAFASTRDAPHAETLDPGERSAVKIPVPANLRAATGLIPVSIVTELDYVPVRDTPPSHSLLALLHLQAPQSSSDTRPLGVVLLYLYFE